MAIIDVEARLDSVGTVNIDPTYNFDARLQGENSLTQAKLRVRLPSKITIDLSQVGISLPEGANINFSMTEGFVRESYGGSNETALPLVENFFQLRTPITAEAELESLADSEIVLIRLRDNDIEAGALFTPDIEAFGTFVGEIPLFVNSLVTSIVGGIYPQEIDEQTAIASLDEDYTRLRFAEITENTTTQFNTDNTRLRLFTTQINVESSLASSVTKLKGITDENFIVVSQFSASPIATLDAVANLNANFDSQASGDVQLGLLANVSVTSEFNIPKIDGVPWDTIATLTANTAAFTMMPNTKIFFRDDGKGKVWEYEQDVVRELDLASQFDIVNFAVSENNLLAVQIISGTVPSGVKLFDLSVNFNDTTSKYQEISSLEPENYGNLKEVNSNGTVLVFDNGNTLRFVDVATENLIEIAPYSQSAEVLTNNNDVYVSNTSNGTTDVYNINTGLLERSENIPVTFVTNDHLVSRQQIQANPGDQVLTTVLKIYNFSFGLISTIENEEIGFAYEDYVITVSIFDNVKVYKVSDATLVQTIDNANEVRGSYSTNQDGTKIALSEFINGDINIHLYNKLEL